MFSFRAGKTEISVDIGFLAVIAIISLTGKSFCLYSFIACIIHEAGHLAAIVTAGRNVKSISFSITGVTIFHSSDKLESYFGEMAVLAAGPAANLAAAAALYHYGNISFAAVNLILGVFNLLPFSSLDGGSIISLFVRNMNNAGNQSAVMKAVHAADAVICAVSAILWFESGSGNISVPVMIIYLLINEFFSDSENIFR